MNTIRKDKEIDINKIYKIPSNIRTIFYKNKIIIISVDTARWLVLDNEEQLSFFKMLNVMSIAKALEKFEGNQEDALNVIIQLEAKSFEDTNVMIKNDIREMHVYLTNACNMRCPHCYMYAGKALEEELTIFEIKDLLYHFKKNKGNIVTFSGGEICTRCDLLEIVKYSHSLGLESNLLTNGTLWTEESIKAISPYTTRVQISIDGYSEETNARVRGKGSFQKALFTVEEFLKQGVFVEVGITPWYDETLKKDYKLYADFGKHLLDKYNTNNNFRIKFNSYLLDGRELKLTPEQKQEYEKIMFNVNILCYGDISDIPFIEFHKKGGIENNCSYGNLAVNSNGDLFYCAAIPTKRPFANLRKDSMERIMYLSELARKTSDVKNILPCKNCELMYICGGDCRIKYFPELVDCDIEHLENAPTRKCNQSIKDSFYDIMIRTNNDLFQ